MPADQAAGLRRRRAQRPPRCIHGFFDSTDAAGRLAHALHQRGWTSLLVDTRGRPFADSPTRSLFDWQQQLRRRQLHTLPQSYGASWVAPGVCADAPALMTTAQGYDCVVFDAALDLPDWTPSEAIHFLVIEVGTGHPSILRGFAVLKTLSGLEGRVSAGLLGDAAACDHLRAACKRFLDPAFAEAVYSVAYADDVFAALAVRMTGEETRLTARHIIENTGNMALKHGC
ncbi:MAG: hypothetical protein ACYCY9_13390 [Thiobacillus sp.]